mmetsp:Transcript_106764/g.168696  ORF Transcript_106764/g.168696 Transcript_106764/m.168696 type:complete len:117 (-) Transcript_106764:105-455(-)
MQKVALAFVCFVAVAARNPDADEQDALARFLLATQGAPLATKTRTKTSLPMTQKRHAANTFAPLFEELVQQRAGPVTMQGGDRVPLALVGVVGGVAALGLLVLFLSGGYSGLGSSL